MTTEPPRPRASVPVVLVVAGGAAAPRPELRAALPVAPVLVVAADSGVQHAERLDLCIDVVVGDLDSVDAAALRRAVQQGARIERHRVDKDKTDLELALDTAVQAKGADASYVVVASVGGRLDHGLANLLLLASPAYASVSVEAYVDDWHITVVRAATRIPTRPGGLVTLLPVGGDVTGVVTEGLQYPLRRETLGASTTRGVSNVATGTEAVVGLDAGVLLVLRQWAD